MPHPRELIVKLLRNLGGRKEVEQYLKQFSSVEHKRFAVIKVGGGLLADDLESLASSLNFLHQVGLHPVVVHGVGPQLQAAFEAAGVDPNDWQQRTSPRALEQVRRVFRAENLRLVDMLEEMGARGRPVVGGVFAAELDDGGRGGEQRPQIVRVDTDAIDSSLKAGSMPVLASIGETAGGQILDLGPDLAAHALALRLQPYKIILLRAQGGLRDEYGDLISAVNLAEDYEPLLAEPWLSAATRHKLELIHDLLGKLPRASSVSITSPDLLAMELFTHKGSGTLVRRGERIILHQSLASVDLPRLAGLLTAAFGRPPVADYFTRKPFRRIYLADSYRAAAILTDEGPIPYLDKFAVTGEAQGEGIGGSLWLRMTRETPKLFWRARVDNPINPWYFQRADGSYTGGTWTVFWTGVTDFPTIQECVERALAAPPTLEAAHTIGGTT
ncbi:acetylglutamate kinase [Nannocystis radixulma]|uniref:acetylglutamate kinase n=1 Tax=Nannocystis radixulma TaxID=2995305 RepID=A0ABT5BFZ3_9BACT|nr:acetylglutamate kinase [Nannocystis radixulma]MDC0673048.1 acetylglutamate kinase [Nannocystis radixulma]